MCTVATVRRLCIYGEEEGKAETGNVNVDKMYNRDQSPLSRISSSWLCAHHLLPPPPRETSLIHLEHAARLTGHYGTADLQFNRTDTCRMHSACTEAHSMLSA